MYQGDEADRANEIAQRERDAGIAAIRARAAQIPQPTGRCFYCDEVVSDERRFCDADCASEYEREQEAIKRNGGIYER